MLDNVFSYFENLSRQELARMAVTDALTGTLKRDVLFLGPASQNIVKTAQEGRLNTAMCDLDHFKKLNDTYGHAFGDDVLQKTGATLRKAFEGINDGEDVYIVRYGGEEFAVFGLNMAHEDFMNRIYHFRDLLRMPIITPMSDADIRLTASVGVLKPEDAKAVAHCPPERDASGLSSKHYSIVSALLSRADEALYYAKKAGRDNVRLFDAGTMEVKLSYNNHDELENSLNKEL